MLKGDVSLFDWALISHKQKTLPVSGERFLLYNLSSYCRNEISTPAATAEPITPEILLDIQYCKI